MSDWLRNLLAGTTPGPWVHIEQERGGGYLVGQDLIIVCDPYGPNPQDARLIALAPDLARVCADLADALRIAYEVLISDGYTQDSDWSERFVPIPVALAAFDALAPKEGV